MTYTRGVGPRGHADARRIIVPLVALGLGVAMVGCGGGSRELVGYTRDPAPRVDAVMLPDVSREGEPFEFRAADGGLLVVYFGYTNCPDVCPTTMADLRQALAELGDENEEVEVAMVTVDPARDTDVLTSYVQGFIADSHAIATDDVAALRSVAETFGVTFETATDQHGDVEVGHGSFLFGVDDTGTLVITWPFGTPSDDLAADMEQLLAQSA
jgi:protein SCO1/2